MILERFPEIEKLTVDEQLQLCSELQGRIFIIDDEPVRDAAILQLLEHRHAEYLRDPSTARPWSEVRARLRRKYIEKSSE